jgi:hypothetical protein
MSATKNKIGEKRRGLLSRKNTLWNNFSYVFKTPD